MPESRKESAFTPDQTPLFPVAPFSRHDWTGRILPFAVVAVLAVLSVFLPPGPNSIPDLLISIGLLLAVAAAFWLPWDRLPPSTTVLVPLTYLTSILFLILATGETSSGIGIVILSPLLWCCLFHREWETACLILGILVVEVITSFVPVEVSTSVLIRRVAFWALMSCLAAIAIHGLRRRVKKSQDERDNLHEQLRTLALIDDRERIGNELRNSTIHRIMTVNMDLEGTRGRSKDPEMAERIGKSIRDLEEAAKDLRSAVFDTNSYSPRA